MGDEKGGSYDAVLFIEDTTWSGLGLWTNICRLGFLLGSSWSMEIDGNLGEKKVRSAGHGSVGPIEPGPERCGVGVGAECSDGISL